MEHSDRAGGPEESRQAGEKGDAAYEPEGLRKRTAGGTEAGSPEKVGVRKHDISYGETRIS